MFDKLKQLGDVAKLRSQAMAMKKKLEAQEIEVEDNGIKVVVSGDQKIKKVEIDGQDRRDIADVMNKAIRESQEMAAKELQQMTGGLGGLLGM